MSRLNHIKIHRPKDFISMRKAGSAAAIVLDYITPYIIPGITTIEINDLCHDKIRKLGCVPAPLNYKGYPKSVCTSVNHVICHGIPGERKLKIGDIVNIDVTVIRDGWHGDTSRMYYVGEDISILAKRLIQTTYDAMFAAIRIIKPNVLFSKIGSTIQQYVESRGFSVVRDYCGHGIGKSFHEKPNVLHYYDDQQSDVMQEGMFFTIEPMVNVGRPYSKILNDGWTVVTRDRSLSAQFEHSIGVTKDSYEIFTLSPQNRHFPPYS